MKLVGWEEGMKLGVVTEGGKWNKIYIKYKILKENNNLKTGRISEAHK